MNPKIQELRDKRGRLVQQMREFVNSEKEARQKSDESAASDYARSFERCEAEERSIYREIQLLEREEESKREAAGQHAPSDNEQRSGNPEEYRSAFERYFRSGTDSLDNEQKALLKVHYRGTSPQSTTAALGGYTIPTGFMAELEKSMLDYSGIMQAARIIRTDGGNTMYWPTADDTGTSAVLVSEGSSTTVADITFAQKQLDAYTYRTLAQISEELMQDSAFNMEATIRDLFAERFGRAFNAALTTGTGSSQPNGVVTGSTLGKTAASATAFTYAEMLDLVHSIDPAYRIGQNVGFMFNDAVLAAIKKLSIGSSDAFPVWQPGMTSKDPDTVLGYRYWINQNMDSALTTGKKIMLFGDFSKYVVRMVRDVTVRRLNERYAESLLVGMLGFARIDGEILNSAAIKRLVLA